ncbi:MAG: hypothetical protein PV340_05125 [Wolbachia sp.]|nr:hypothetical protein [Wolbachia sp.]
MLTHPPHYIVKLTIEHSKCQRYFFFRTIKSAFYGNFISYKNNNFKVWV